MRPADPLRRNISKAVVGLLAAGVAAPRLLAQPRQENSRVSIAVGGKASLYHLPLTVALQLGYFRAEGLAVEVTDFSDGAGALDALTQGHVDLVSGAYEHTIVRQGRGQSLRAFVLQGRAPQIAVGVSTRAMPGFRALSELRGRRIGVSAPDTSTSRVARMVLRRAGLEAGDVRYVGVGTSTGAIAALRSGQIDAISNVEPVMSVLEHRGEVKIISDTRTLKGTRALFDGLMPSGCLFAPAEFIRQHPAVCQAMANAIVRALKWLRTAGPGDIIRTVPEAYLLGDRGLYLSAFNKVSEAFSLDGLLHEDSARTALQVMAVLEPTVRADRLDLSRTYTNEFASRAKLKFKA